MTEGNRRPWQAEERAVRGAPAFNYGMSPVGTEKRRLYIGSPSTEPSGFSSPPLQVRTTRLNSTAKMAENETGDASSLYNPDSCLQEKQSHKNRHDDGGAFVSLVEGRQKVVFMLI